VSQFKKSTLSTWGGGESALAMYDTMSCEFVQENCDVMSCELVEKSQTFNMNVRGELLEKGR
jgi:hypothetical protein